MSATDCSTVEITRYIYARICRRYFHRQTLHTNHKFHPQDSCVTHILYSNLLLLLCFNISGKSMKQERKSNMNLMYDMRLIPQLDWNFQYLSNKLDLKQQNKSRKRRRRLLSSIWYFISGFNICSKEHRPRPILGEREKEKKSNYMHIFLRRF